MKEQRQREIRDEVRREQVEFLNAHGGILELGKKANLSDDVAYQHKKACDDAAKFADKDGEVDPNIQTIFARLYGLV